MATFVDALFVIGLVLPPAAVAFGMVILAWPGQRARNAAVRPFQAHAH